MNRSISRGQRILANFTRATLTNRRLVGVGLGAKVETYRDPVRWSDAEPRGPLPTFLKTSASIERPDRPYVRSHSPGALACTHVRGREVELHSRREGGGGGGEGGRISGSCACCAPRPREARRTLLEVSGSRVRWLFAAIDASTPRITPRFLNVHLLFLLLPGRLTLPPPPPLSPPATTSIASRFVSSSVPASVRPFPFSIERRSAVQRGAERHCVIDTPR